MNSEKAARVYAYDNLKFLLILFVIWGHLVTAYTGQYHLFKSLFVFIYTFHMPAFLFIGGLFSKKTLIDGNYVRTKVYFFLTLYVLLKFLIYLVLLLYGKTEFHLLTEDGVPWYLLVMAECFILTYLTRKVNRRLLLVLSIVLACVAGYIPSLGDFLCLSRLIAFYPFFLAGISMDPAKLLKVSEKPVFRIGSFIVLLVLAYTALFQTKYLSGLLPLLTGRHPFCDIDERFAAYGGILRLCCYIGSGTLIFCWISIIPRRKCFLSEMGKRTIQPYFLHRPILFVLQYFNVCGLLSTAIPSKMWMFVYLAIGLGLCILLSQKWLEAPFAQLQKNIYRCSRK